MVGWRASWDGHRRPVSAAPRAAGLRRFVTRTQGACARCPCSLNYLGKQHAARRLRGGRRQAAGWAPRGGRVGRLLFTCADPVLHPPPCRPFGVSLSRGAAAVAAARRGADLPAGERAPAGGGRGRAHSAAQQRTGWHARGMPHKQAGSERRKLLPPVACLSAAACQRAAIHAMKNVRPVVANAAGGTRSCPFRWPVRSRSARCAGLRAACRALRGR